MNKWLIKITPVLLPFAQYPCWQKLALFVLFAFLLLVYPLWQGQELKEKRLALKEQQQQTELALKQVKQGLQELKQKQLAQELTPALARQLMPIDQYILQQQSSQLHLHPLQWRMGEKPVLHLNMQGSFNALYQFFHQLLRQYPPLSLVSLQLEKDSENKENQQFLWAESVWQLDLSQLAPAKES